MRAKATCKDTFCSPLVRITDHCIDRCRHCIDARIIVLTNDRVNSYIVTMTTWQPDLAGFAGPRYLAIADALSEDIRQQRVAPGTRLPTHRDLAYRLGVTVPTVTPSR